VCLITSTHVAHNPRLVKEADALAATGYAVRVVACQSAGWIADRDATLVSGRPWRFDAVRAIPGQPGGRRLRLVSGLRARLFRHLVDRLRRGQEDADRALSRFHPELLREVCQEPADLFVAHTLEALPAAHAAALRFGARLGFDAEDLHTGELAPSERGTWRARLVARVEGGHIGHCDYVSAPSPEVAAELERLYAVPRPIVLHNVFPWADRDAVDGLVKDRQGARLSLYWYSQVVGPDRGIEDAIRASGGLGEAVALHVRGAASSGERRRLTALARECGGAARLHFHEPVPPGELLSRAAEHDVGLALEMPGTENHRLTASNKLFVYLLAGLAVAATDVPGQRSILENWPGVGFLYTPGDALGLAAGLRRWLEEPDELRRCRRTALEAARRRWNWEIESRALLAVVERLIGAPGLRETCPAAS
jgi:glycosyltransferase involved in cell wall biosynthesis